MADDAISPASPLAGLHDEFAAADVPGDEAVRLREIPFRTQIGVRARPGTPAHEAIAAATGVGLPEQAGDVAGSADATGVLWLGPDEFLVVAPHIAAGLATGVVADLETTLGSHAGQVVDLSAARAVLELTGPGARAVLESGVPADLHPRALPPGHAITTQLGTVRIILWHTHPDRYLVLTGRSFAAHTAQWLLDAMRSIAAG